MLSSAAFRDSMRDQSIERLKQKLLSLTAHAEIAARLRPNPSGCDGDSQTDSDQQPLISDDLPNGR